MKTIFPALGAITGAEHLVAAISSGESLAMLQQPRAGLVSEVPEAARQTHEKLVAIGASYYALDDNNGSLCLSPTTASGARTAW